MTSLFSASWKNPGISFYGSSRAPPFVPNLAWQQGLSSPTLVKRGLRRTEPYDRGWLEAVAPKDPFFSNAVLLLSGDGTNGSTTFTDESPQLHGDATVNSTATVSTAQKVFGTGSILGPRLSYNNSADWDFAAGSFTLEGRIRPTDVTTFQMILAHWMGVVGFPFLSWYVSIQSGNLKWTVSTDGFNSLNDMTSSTTLVVNTWYAWAIDFDGAKYRMYLDGVMVASFSTPRIIFTVAPALGERLGINDSGDGGFPYSGYQDEVRITKGVARYASDAGYTPATAAFPRS